jgi:hypothetical protein
MTGSLVGSVFAIAPDRAGAEAATHRAPTAEAVRVARTALADITPGAGAAAHVCATAQARLAGFRQG